MTTTETQGNYDSVLNKLGEFRAEFDQRFEKHLTTTRPVPAELLEAIRYSALAPGKRIRPYLVKRCCELSGGAAADAWAAGAAVECVHVFSLIHDDLPAMDDDDLRRGQPTNHKRFGEAVAILAGDALVVLSFELLTGYAENPALAVNMIRELAHGAGWSGMIGGQTADILGEQAAPALEQARYIHERKTASLFETACRLGALAGGAEPELVAAFGRYGHGLGRAFQIADDLLDVTATADVMGKGVSKDARAGKQTFPRCMGVERSREAARQAAREASGKLERFGGEADDLRELLHYVVYRNY